jgi:hypothetical protein
MATATVPVVVWSHDQKIEMSCSVSVDTTFEDVITSLGLYNIHSALVGHRDVPFKLMAGDFAPDDDYNPDAVPKWYADKFTGKVMDVVFWMSFIGEGPITEGKKILATKKEEIQAMLADVLAGHEIHLFMYDHRDDCCFTESPSGAFTERDPATTTETSSLWLRLEKEFIEGPKRGESFDGWTHTAGWIHTDANEKRAHLVQMRALVEAL